MAYTCVCHFFVVTLHPKNDANDETSLLFGLSGRAEHGGDGR